MFEKPLVSTTCVPTRSSAQPSTMGKAVGEELKVSAKPKAAFAREMQMGQPSKEQQHC